MPLTAATATEEMAYQEIFAALKLGRELRREASAVVYNITITGAPAEVSNALFEELIEASEFHRFLKGRNMWLRECRERGIALDGNSPYSIGEEKARGLDLIESKIAKNKKGIRGLLTICTHGKVSGSQLTRLVQAYEAAMERAMPIIHEYRERHNIHALSFGWRTRRATLKYLAAIDTRNYYFECTSAVMGQLNIRQLQAVLEPMDAHDKTRFISAYMEQLPVSRDAAAILSQEISKIGKFKGQESWAEASMERLRERMVRLPASAKHPRIIPKGRVPRTH